MSIDQIDFRFARKGECQKTLVKGNIFFESFSLLLFPSNLTELGNVISSSVICYLLMYFSEQHKPGQRFCNGCLTRRALVLQISRTFCFRESCWCYQGYDSGITRKHEKKKKKNPFLFFFILQFIYI